MTNTGELNGRHKDGRRTPGKGHRLGWVTNKMYQEMKAQAEAQGMTVSDWVIAAIKAALREEGGGIECL